jgi:hypothetical protein
MMKWRILIALLMSAVATQKYLKQKDVNKRAILSTKILRVQVLSRDFYEPHRRMEVSKIFGFSSKWTPDDVLYTLHLT